MPASRFVPTMMNTTSNPATPTATATDHPESGAAAAVPTLRLLTRSYCSLCQDMREALVPLQQELGFVLLEADIDRDKDELFPGEAENFDELVPVLLYGKRLICYWHLEEEALRAYLAQIR